MPRKSLNVYTIFVDILALVLFDVFEYFVQPSYIVAYWSQPSANMTIFQQPGCHQACWIATFFSFGKVSRLLMILFITPLTRNVSFHSQHCNTTCGPMKQTGNNQCIPCSNIWIDFTCWNGWHTLTSCVGTHWYHVNTEFRIADRSPIAIVKSEMTPFVNKDYAINIQFISSDKTLGTV